MFSKGSLALSSPTADTATELHVSNSRLAEVEAAFAAQKSEVGWKPVTFHIAELSACHCKQETM